jgi:hypothetical protein
MEFPISLVLASTAVWFILYYSQVLFVRPNIPYKELWDLRNRLVSVVHANYVLAFSIYLSTQGRSFGADDTWEDRIMVAVSLGYVIYDTVAMLIHGLHDTYILLHHGFMIWGMSNTLIHNTGGLEIAGGFIATELAVTFLHAKEILKALNQYNTRLYLTIELIFFGLFFCGRVLYGVPLIWNIMWSARLWSSIIASSLLLVQGFHWQWQMTGITLTRWKQYCVRCENNESLPWVKKLKTTKVA